MTNNLSVCLRRLRSALPPASAHFGCWRLTGCYSRGERACWQAECPATAEFCRAARRARIAAIFIAEAGFLIARVCFFRHAARRASLVLEEARLRLGWELFVLIVAGTLKDCLSYDLACDGSICWPRCFSDVAAIRDEENSPVPVNTWNAIS